MAIFKRRQRGRERPLAKQFYRDYLRTTFWQLRKRRYFSRYGKQCRICGDKNTVELYHLKDGDYGHESDSDLVALCSEHHKKMEMMAAETGDNFDRLGFVAREAAVFEAQRAAEVSAPQYDYSPSFFSSVHMTLDIVARPIWRILYGFVRW